MKAATLADSGVVRALRVISIHAAREGGDAVADGVPANFDDISIHAAREGGDRFFLLQLLGIA